MTPTPDKDDEYAMRRARVVVNAYLLARGTLRLVDADMKARMNHEANLVRAIAREITRASQPRPKPGKARRG